MKSSYILAGMTLRTLLRLLWRHGITPFPHILLRVFFLLQAAVWSSIFAWRERRLNACRIHNTPAPQDPLFIISHWRTGTTYLHQLMDLDSRFAAPTLFNCIAPHSFLSSRRYMEPVLGRVIRGRRPMDNVRLGFDEPHEDEWALFRLMGFSPLERMIFPRSGEYFLLDEEASLPGSPEEQQRWEEALVLFVKKLHLHSGGKRLVLKNPFHALRLETLQRLFPKAAFIHIQRDPMDAIPSTVHMWSVVGKQNALRRGWRPPALEDVITVFARIQSLIREGLAVVPEHRRAELRFEELEQNPMAAMKAIYQQLKLPFTPFFREKIESFVEANAGYKKNKYTVAPEHQQLIRDRLGRYPQPLLSHWIEDSLGVDQRQP